MDPTALNSHSIALSALACLPEAIVILRDDRVLSLNPEFTRLFGYTLAELTDRDTTHLFAADGHENALQLVLQMVHARGRGCHETVCVASNGEPIDVSLLAAPLMLDGAFEGYILSFRDTREARRDTARLQHDTLHDKLTTLPNRVLFIDRLRQSMARRERDQEHGCGVVFIDLDGFKQVNDSLGHAAGDALLVQVATRLRAAIRPQDTAARLSGDEFALVLDRVLTTDDLAVVASRVLAELIRPFTIQGKSVSIGASIGVALCANEHKLAEQLLRDADFAMYRAKEQGGGRFEIFNRSLQVHLTRRRKRESQLRAILAERRFLLWYQPFYRLASDQVAADCLEGFEALLRWRRDDGSVHSFADLLPAADAAGLSITLARETLFEARGQLHLWSGTLPVASFTLAINLSARQFYQPELVGLIQSALDGSAPNGSALAGSVIDRYVIDPRRILLEIPESALDESPDEATRILTRLSEFGLRLAIDRFGSGLASVNHLLRMPIDLIKFDPALVYAAAEGDRQMPVLAALIQIAHSLGITTLAHSVETAAQRLLLRQLGCQMAQGFLYSPAVPAARAETLLAQSILGPSLPLRKLTAPSQPARNLRQPLRRFSTHNTTN